MPNLGKDFRLGGDKVHRIPPSDCSQWSTGKQCGWTRLLSAESYSIPIFYAISIAHNRLPMTLSFFWELRNYPIVPEYIRLDKSASSGLLYNIFRSYMNVCTYFNISMTCVSVDSSWFINYLAANYGMFWLIHFVHFSFLNVLVGYFQLPTWPHNIARALVIRVHFVLLDIFLCAKLR